MADRYDGAINIKTLVDNKGINKGLSQTAKEIDRLTTNFEKQAEKIKQQNAELENLRSKLQAIAKGEKPQELIELEKQLKNTEKQVDKQAELRNKLLKTYDDENIKLNDLLQKKELIENSTSNIHAEEAKIGMQLNNQKAIIDTISIEKGFSVKQIEEAYAKYNKLNEEFNKIKITQEAIEEGGKIDLYGEIEKSTKMISLLDKQLEEVDIKFYDTGKEAEKLSYEIEKIKIDPTASQEFQDLTNKIEQGSLALDASKDRAIELQNELLKLSTPFGQTIQDIYTKTENITSEIQKQQNEYQTLNTLYEQTKSELNAAKESGDSLAESLAQANMDRTEKDIEKIDSKIKNLYFESEKLKVAFEDITLNPQNTDEAYNLRAQISGIAFMLDDTSKSARTLSAEMSKAFKTEEISQVDAELINIGKSSINLTTFLNKIKDGFKKIGVSVLSMIGSMKLLNKETKNSTSGFEKLANRIKNLVVAVFVFNIIRRGLRQLQQGLMSALKQNDQFVNSLAQIKGNLLTAFQPIYNAVLPAINALMSALAKITAYVASFVNVVFGKSIKQSQDAAKAMYNQAKATSAAGKAAENASSSIDELSVISENTAGAAAGAEIAPSFDIDTSDLDMSILDQFAEWIEKIKQLLQPVIDSLKLLWEQLKIVGSFAWDALKDFYNSFLKPVGLWTLGEGLPRFIDAITKGLAAIDWQKINDSIHELWNALAPFAINVGEGLLRLWENVLVPLGTWVIGKGFPNFIDGITKLVSGIDWNKLNTSLDRLWKLLLPFAINIGEGLLWFWNNVLVPLGTWTINDVIPSFLDILSGAIDFLNTTIESIKPIFQWFWNKILVPIAEWTGGLIVDILRAIGDALRWIADNEIAMAIIEGIAIAIGLVTTALQAYNIVTAIMETVQLAAAAAGGILAIAVNAINLPLVLITAAIAALIAIGILLYKNWDVIKEKALEIWESIKAFISEQIERVKLVITTAIEIIQTVWNTIWTAIKTTVTNIWDYIKNLISTTINTIKSSITAVLNGIKTVWNNIWNGLSDTTKNVFNNIWSVIKKVINSILGGIESMVNGVINGINGMVRALNRLHFSIPEWVPGLGGKSFGFSLSELGQISIPKLATGGIVDQATIAMIGERGREAVLPLDRNTQWQDALADKVVQRINSDETNNLIRETNQLIASLADAIRNSSSAIYLDGREVGSSIESWQQNKGIQTTGGGFINAY